MLTQNPLTIEGQPCHEPALSPRPHTPHEDRLMSLIHTATELLMAFFGHMRTARGLILSRTTLSRTTLSKTTLFRMALFSVGLCLASPVINAEDSNPAIEPVVKPADANENPARQSEENQTSQEFQTFQKAIIDNEEAGPYNPALSEIYYGMGLHLQRRGRHEEAIKFFNQTMHIERINQGIYSLAQDQAMRSVISSHKALTQLEETTDDYYRLLWLHKKNLSPVDPRMIPVLLELSRWHLTAYQFDDSSTRIDHLTTSNDLITKALKLSTQIDAQNTEISVQSLHDLLRNAALTSFFLARHEGDEWSSASDSHFSLTAREDLDVISMRTAVLSRGAYARGRKAHETIVAMLESDKGSSAEQRIRSYTELADWHLLFGKRKKAYAVYREALAIMPQAQHPVALTEELFNHPVMLPAIRNESPRPGAGRQMKHPKARVRMDIAPSGWASNIEILNSDNPEAKQMRRRTSRALRDARFRPRFVNGDPVASQGDIIAFPLLQ